MRTFLLLVLACTLGYTQAGILSRRKRGYLSRTGFCLKPAENFYHADERLNFYGVAVEPEKPTGCEVSDCDEDSHCEGDKKCCDNYCGAKVCTPSVRAPHPCQGFKCPSGEVCKLQRVQCVMPDCPSVQALNRPTCIPAKGLSKTEDLENIGNHIPDTAAQLLQADSLKANKQQDDKDNDSQDENAQEGDDQNEGYQQDNAEPAPFQQASGPFQAGQQMAAEGLQQGDDQAMAYSNQQALQPPIVPLDVQPPSQVAPSQVASENTAQFAPFGDNMNPSPMGAVPFGPTQGGVSQLNQQYAPEPFDQSRGLMPLTGKRSSEKRSTNKRDIKKTSIKKRSMKKRSIKKRSMKKRSIKKRSIKKRSV
ncbi:predicted protein [Nematostella vectensis]|uniref:WAP domain-containing protein n=1 Tax=Nematostella vectensis TaxID=45351 RepID=A7RS00_NEMVE|nr:uncharacterized protein LOC5517731 [Nematostella vectensis]EDO45715.1 predicted protein [Nematostella vectensis]|eukprot:XP_001637778.1 predicted protein [Nematostella vectensis]